MLFTDFSCNVLFTLDSKVSRGVVSRWFFFIPRLSAVCICGSKGLLTTDFKTIMVHFMNKFDTVAIV